MNSKITALFAVAVMVTAGFVLVADTAGTDAKVIKDEFTTAIDINKGASHNITLYTDEYQYKSYGYSLTWYVDSIPDNNTDQASLDKITLTDNDRLGTRTNDTYSSLGSVDVDGLTFTLTERNHYNSAISNVGEYNLNVKATDEDVVNPDVKVFVKCEIKVTLNSDPIQTYDVESLYYLYNFNIETPSEINFGTVEFTNGINDSTTLKDTEGITVADYDWFATALPSGLSMNRNGTISGTSHATDGKHVVPLVGTSKNNPLETVDAKITIKINAATTGGIVLRLDGDVSEVSTGIYATERGSYPITLTVSQGSGYSLDVLTVRIVDSDGNVSITDDTQKGSTKFVIASESEPINGTGLYKIYVTAVVNSDKQVECIDLYVLGDLDSVFAEIIVSGA